MKAYRRRFLCVAAGAVALPAVSRIAWSQAYVHAAGAYHCWRRSRWRP